MPGQSAVSYRCEGQSDYSMFLSTSRVGSRFLRANTIWEDSHRLIGRSPSKCPSHPLGRYVDAVSYERHVWSLRKTWNQNPLEALCTNRISRWFSYRKNSQLSAAVSTEIRSRGVDQHTDHAASLGKGNNLWHCKRLVISDFGTVNNDVYREEYRPSQERSWC